MASYASLTPNGGEVALGPIDATPRWAEADIQRSVVLANGDLYVLRYDFSYTPNSPNDDERLIGRTYDRHGNPTSPDVVVWGDEGLVGAQRYDVAALTTGGHVAGFNFTPGINVREHLARTVTFDGATVERVLTHAGAVSNEPMLLDIAPLGGGGYVAAWSPDPFGTDPGEIWVGAFDAGPWSGASQRVANAAGPVFVTGVGPNGDYLFATRGELRYYDTSSGRALSTTFSLPTDVLISAGTSLLGGAETAALVWKQVSGSTQTLLTQRFDLSKGGFIGEASVLDVRDYAIKAPHVVATADGGYVVSWQAWGEQGYRLAKVVGPMGDVSPEFVINGDVVGLRNGFEVVAVREDLVSDQLFMQTYTPVSPDPSHPPPPPQPGGSGQVINSPGPGSTLQGGSGNDTLNASQGSDTLTGAGGGDTFAWAREPWSPATVKDFAVGSDRLDLSKVFQAAGYAGSDPIADGRIVLTAQGGDTLVLFDDDGAGGDWPNYIIKLEGVATSGLTWSKLSGGGTTEPSPTGGGQVINSPGPGAALTGTAGDDTLNASQGSDILTGAGGADHFVFAKENWSPARITDFEDKVDRIDIRGMLDAIGYTGTDPFAAGLLKMIDDGAGGTKVLFDRDAGGPNPVWPNYVIHVEKVGPAALTSSDWIFQ